jgi:Ca2+-binding RTX toxin-like protein
MLAFLSNMFGGKPAPRRSVSRRPNRRRFGSFESLDDRRMMSVNTFVDSSGALAIYGDQYALNSVSVVPDNIAGTAYYKVTSGNSIPTWFTPGQVWGGSVTFYGGYYDDYFENASSLRTTAYGNDGSDTLIGSYASDFLDGGYGYDYLYGNGGDDTLYAGWDYVGGFMYGGSGADTMVGCDGVDRMWGGAGNDYMYAYGGNDYLYGESGNDYMFGFSGQDYLDGGLDYDELYGGNDSDSLNGGDDGVYDKLVGGAGYDWFQQEWGWRRNAYYGYWYQYNFDMPIDYEPGEGFYNF